MLLSLWLLVDLLRAGGLRENDLTETGAVRVAGPTGELDSFLLSRSADINASEVMFNIIGANLPSSFAVFAVLDMHRYTGQIISVSEELNDRPLLSISLDNTVNFMHTLINISLPGLEPVRVVIPSSSDGSVFERVGIHVKQSQLVVTINCTVFRVVDLSRPADMLLLDGGVVSLLDSGAIVSRTCLCVCMCVCVNNTDVSTSIQMSSLVRI